MNTPRILLFLLLTAGITRAQAQDNPTPAPATEPAQTEMQKWIATTDAQWQAAFKRDVADVHEAELNKVKLQYLTALDDAIKKASSAGDLDGAVTLRNEQKRFGDTQLFPEQDEAGDAAAVKQIRAAIRAQLAQLEKNNAVRAKALHAKYDQVLEQAQAQLTQRQRFDDAVLVKAKRDEVAAAWITPAITAAVEKATPPAPVATRGPVAKPKAVQAAKEAPITTIEGLTKRLIGTKWIWFETETITFLAGGKARWNRNKNSQIWPWKVTSVEPPVIEGEHVQQGRKFTMTLDGNLKTGTIAESNGVRPRETRNITNE